MAKLGISTKRVAISKANTQTVIVVAVAAFITVFCLVASRAVFNQNQYRSKVTDGKEKAHLQLEKNLKAFDSLVSSYKKFDASPVNVIGGARQGAGDKDGTNARIILDALPSSYDFPALTSSLEKILTERKLKVSNITGIDDQVNQQSKTASPTPKEVIVPFSFSIANANYASVQELIATLQLSIRPIQVDTITLSGGVNDMTLTINAHTYYQPAKTVNITTKVIK